MRKILAEPPVDPRRTDLSEGPVSGQLNEENHNRAFERTKKSAPPRYLHFKRSKLEGIRKLHPRGNQVSFLDAAMRKIGQSLSQTQEEWTLKKVSFLEAQMSKILAGPPAVQRETDLPEVFF